MLPVCALIFLGIWRVTCPVATLMPAPECREMTAGTATMCLADWRGWWPAVRPARRDRG